MTNAIEMSYLVSCQAIRGLALVAEEVIVASHRNDTALMLIHSSNSSLTCVACLKTLNKSCLDLRLKSKSKPHNFQLSIDVIEENL